MTQLPKHASLNNDSNVELSQKHINLFQAKLNQAAGSIWQRPFDSAGHVAQIKLFNDSNASVESS